MGNGLKENLKRITSDRIISWNKTQTTPTISDHYDHASTHSFVSTVGDGDGV